MGKRRRFHHETEIDTAYKLGLFAAAAVTALASARRCRAHTTWDMA